MAPPAPMGKLGRSAFDSIWFKNEFRKFYLVLPAASMPGFGFSSMSKLWDVKPTGPLTFGTFEGGSRSL